MNNTINNRNRTEDGKYTKWDVCEYKGCKNILGDLDDGAWDFSSQGDFYCLNHEAEAYEGGEGHDHAEYDVTK